MNQKKQQLQHNELADWLELKLQELKPYSNIILTGAIVVVAACAGILWWVNSQTRATSEAWIDYFNATDEVRYNRSTDPLLDSAERHPGSTAALWSRQIAADSKLKDGLTLLFQERTSGGDEIQEAIEQYTLVIDGTRSGTMLHDHAVFGRAVANEALGNIDKALEGYLSLVESSPKSEAGEPTNPLAKLALKYHTRLATFPNAGKFYEEFVAYTPSIMPPTNPGFGGPGMGGASSDGLRTLPDISFPDDIDLSSAPDSDPSGLIDDSTAPPSTNPNPDNASQPDLGGGALKPPSNSGSGESSGSDTGNSESGNSGEENSETESTGSGTSESGNSDTEDTGGDNSPA